jgi:hypothetical protein
VRSTIKHGKPPLPSISQHFSIDIQVPDLISYKSGVAQLYFNQQIISRSIYTPSAGGRVLFKWFAGFAFLSLENFCR